MAKQKSALKNGKLYSPNIQKPIVGFNIEYNVDVSAFQGNLLEGDKNATENYYMCNGGVVTDWIGPSTWSQKIKGSVELGIDANGKPKAQGHHPSWFDANNLPRDKDKVDDTKKPIEYGPNKTSK